MSLPPRVRRSLSILGASAGLVGAFAAGTAIAGDDASPGSGPGPQPRGGTDASPVAFSGSDLSLAESCDDLLGWYVARGVDRVGPWGWDGGYGYSVDMPMAADGGATDDSASLQRSSAEAAAPLASTSRVTNGTSGTNVQELGVDEPDVVKTDGRTLFRIEGNDLVTYDVTGAEVARVGSADLVDLRDGEILLAGDTVVAIGHSATGDSPDYRYYANSPTRVIVLDVSDPSAPEVQHTYLYSSSTLEARLHGDTVRLVTQAGLPDLDFEEAGRRDERETERENRQVVRESDIDDWLPTVSTDGGEPERLVDCEDVAIPHDGDTLGTIAVVGFAADEPDTRSTSGLAVDTQLAYVSVDKLYLATSAWSTGGCFDLCIVEDTVTPRWFPGNDSADDGVSHLYAFDLDGRATTYAASGEVDGTIRDRWAMDEAGGVLRVAVGPTGQTGNFNSIVTFRQDGNDLVEAGRVDKLGVGEEIQAMRWFDGLAIMVTFRQVDPLYAIDLTDPDQPTLMGQLKIPGFSAYLHPLGRHRLLGLGEGPTPDGRRWGAQAGLFNVTDLTDPRQLDVVSFGGNSAALAAQDPRQLTWLPEQRTVLTVISDYRQGSQVGLVSVLSLGDGQISTRTVEVEYGSDVSAVRLVPLPDGRVVLVTGGDAEFFDL
jgi:Beta propeller domain